MGLFSFLKQKNNTPNVPEDILTEKEKPGDVLTGENNGISPVQFGINLLYQFLEKNYEAKGYDDALINPDTTHLNQNIETLKNDLERTIRKVKTFYEDFIRETNFHISSRSRSGMVDTVEELIVKKETAESHVKQVKEIEEEAKNNRGVGQGIVLSYTRGFRNGLAAISHHAIVKKNF